MTIRTLRADEIDCRIGQIKENGLSLLLYKDARCDMNILDETFGPLNWKRRHCRDNANCIVSIWDSEKKEWIEKEDTGTESNTEAEKGLASDSFKRACVNVGIGRELYTAPFIWIDHADCNISNTRKCNDKFAVEEIGYDKARNVSKLVIRNDTKRKVVFRWSSGSAVEPPPGAPEYKPTETKAPEKKAPEKKPEAKPAPMYKCASCGAIIKGVSGKAGKIGAMQWTGFTEKHYGQTLCISCLNKQYPDWPEQHGKELQ